MRCAEEPRGAKQRVVITKARSDAMSAIASSRSPRGAKRRVCSSSYSPRRFASRSRSSNNVMVPPCGVFEGIRSISPQKVYVVSSTVRHLIIRTSSYYSIHNRFLEPEALHFKKEIGNEGEHVTEVVRMG